MAVVQKNPRPIQLGSLNQHLRLFALPLPQRNGLQAKALGRAEVENVGGGVDPSGEDKQNRDVKLAGGENFLDGGDLRLVVELIEVFLDIDRHVEGEVLGADDAAQQQHREVGVNLELFEGQLLLVKVFLLEELLDVHGVAADFVQESAVFRKLCQLVEVEPGAIREELGVRVGDSLLKVLGPHAGPLGEEVPLGLWDFAGIAVDADRDEEGEKFLVSFKEAP